MKTVTSSRSASRSSPCGTFSSSTMMVMITAITPSLNASSRPFVMAHDARRWAADSRAAATLAGGDAAGDEVGGAEGLRDVAVEGGGGDEVPRLLDGEAGALDPEALRPPLDREAAG